MIIDGEALTGEMTRGLLSNLERVINSRQDLDRYYLLTYSKANPIQLGRIDTKIILTKQRPAPLVGSMCFKVDNKAGKLEVEWLLPHVSDRPLPIDNGIVRQWVKDSEKKFWQDRL